MARPTGCGLADLWCGPNLIQHSAVLMIVGTFGVAHFVSLAQGSLVPQSHFAPFLLCYLVVFVAISLSNAAAF